MNTLGLRNMRHGSKLVLAVVAACATAAAQDLKAPLQTPVVNADHSVTFRYYAPTASKVGIALDLYKTPIAMAKGTDGVWTATTAPLAPEFYGYDVVTDGVTSLDPFNPNVRFNYVFLANQVMVPGTPPEPWELTAVPHGRVDHHCFTTHVARNLAAGQSCYAVYTPPGYLQPPPASAAEGYPVLYLLHGWSDNETAWTQIGRADIILDNLIASGKAVPMIVVMPLGYGNFDFVTHGFNVWRDAPKVDENTKLFADELETEVMPAVESSYRVAKNRDSRAIAGLSMGGLESLTIGLNHTDQFAYVAGMSAAIHLGGFDTRLAGFDAKTAKLKLLWVGCGLGDDLLQPNREFITWAKAKGQPVTVQEIPGAHNWLVWRANLVDLAPRLFR